MNKTAKLWVRGFSLVEVVVAVGIFALAIVGVIGLFGTTSRNVSNVAETDAATRVFNAIQSELQGIGFTAVKNSFAADISSDFNFFASRNGDKIGGAGAVPEDERFFEFVMIRNDQLSPVSNDNSAGFLAFNIVLRWPAYVPTATAGVGTKVTDNNQKSVMIAPAAVVR